HEEVAALGVAHEVGRPVAEAPVDPVDVGARRLGDVRIRGDDRLGHGSSRSPLTFGAPTVPRRPEPRQAAELWHSGAREDPPMSAATIVNPQYLVGTEGLAAHLAHPHLRIFDCTTYLDPAPVAVYTVRSGRPEWAAGHVPGAGYLDLHGELSDTSSPLRFTMPPAEQFAAAMSRHGVGEGTRVVLYSAGAPMWATRIWSMLRAF